MLKLSHSSVFVESQINSDPKALNLTANLKNEQIHNAVTLIDKVLKGETVFADDQTYDFLVNALKGIQVKTDLVRRFNTRRCLVCTEDLAKDTLMSDHLG